MRLVGCAIAQRAGEQTALNKDKLGIAHFFSEERMRDLLCFALLVGGYEELASQLGQLHRAAVTDDEVRGFQLAAVHEGKSDPLNPRSKLFHEIERERFSAGAVGVEKADERIEADRGERRCAIMSKQRVEKRQQTVERIAGGAAASAVEGKLRAEWWAEVPDKHIEMERGGPALYAPYYVEIVGCKFEFTQEISELLGYGAQ